VKAFFKSHKLFLIFFLKNFSVLIFISCQCFRERLSLLRVQKYTTIPVTQAFSQTIFNLFYKPLVLRFLQRKVFFIVLSLLRFLAILPCLVRFCREGSKSRSLVFSGFFLISQRRKDEEFSFFSSFFLLRLSFPSGILFWKLMPQSR
ncbi:hypothetical protein, partial [Flavobacterium soyae]|uniref:hypothetical protein n=1 Tax=Flavobacterium soyae TaxID=2903098 RepID=UPI001E65BA63